MSKPGFWRNVGGAIVNTFLSPGTTPYGPNGKYNRTLLRNGLINLAARTVNPVAGGLAQYATNKWGGGQAQEMGQQGWQWLAKQPITDGATGGGLANVNPGTINGGPWTGDTGGIPEGYVPEIGQPAESQTGPRKTLQGQPQDLAGLMAQGYLRDHRSGRSAGSSVLAEGKAAQGMVEGMQMARWLGTRSPYTFKGEK